jgi:hypothetical protein
LGFEKSSKLFLLVEPGTQGLAYGGVASRLNSSMSETPIEVTIEAIKEIGRQADTDDA